MHRPRYRQLVALAASLLLVQAVYAGGPLAVGGPTFGVNGQAFTWNPATDIQYRTDGGPLSGTVDEPTARMRVADMFQVWEDVATSNIGFSRATNDGGNGVGFINDVAPDFTDGDVSNGVEFLAVEDDCFNGNQNIIVYDADGQIFIDLMVDETSVIGFAGPCSVVSNGTFGGGEAVMNGLFQDGDGMGTPNVPDLTTAEFDAAFIHEFGHFSGLDHSQINLNCLTAFPCPADDLAGLPTMFPILLSDTQASLSDDDIAWISRLYPSGTFNTTHGTITGTVFFTDTMSHAQGVNVIARRVDTGANEDRTNAVSVVSGFRFTANQGNPILNNTPSSFGSNTPAHIGLFEIPVPAGNYRIEVEGIDPSFDAGSSVGPLDPPIPLPGAAPAPSAIIAVGAGATVSGNNVTLIGTDPRFDQFEDSDLSRLIVPRDLQLPWLRKRLSSEVREVA